jgi:hypothetical protein
MAVRVQGEAAAALAARRVLDRAYVPLRRCYEELVGRESKAAGSLVVSFVVGKDGKAERDANATGTPADASFTACITKTIAELTFAGAATESRLTATFDTSIPPPPPPERTSAPALSPPISRPALIDVE